MTRAAGQRSGNDLAGWLAEQGLGLDAGPGGIADPARVRSLLVAAARDGRALSYSELLGLLGHPFTRPKMRALCRTLDAIDQSGEARGESGLAVLVVRESDRLPGQGWWIGAAERWSYAGPWLGPDAAAFVRDKQGNVFRFWARPGIEEGTGAKPSRLPSERRRAVAQKGAGGNPGAETKKGGDAGSGTKSKTTGGKGGGGRSSGSKSGGGGNSGGGSRAGAQ